VHLASIFCSNDDYTVGPLDTWTEGSRGVCLVTKIDATLTVGTQQIQATPYTSSGTFYSQFVIIQQGENSAVTRVVSEKDDVGELLPEPTEKQNRSSGIATPIDERFYV
jgi:hypothetical protein